jgi:MFS family permease
MGAVSDRIGRAAVLRIMAAGGMALSLAIGWCAGLPGPLLLMLAFVYGFAIHGDSGVLSTAMTEAVAPRDLGTLLALRSIVGWGIGALAPLAFGRILDLTNAPGALPSVWGWAFLILAVGGAVATLAALSLREPKPA